MSEIWGVSPEVLIADDEESVCFSLKRLLDRRGYVVHIVADGQAAVEVVRSRGGRLGVVFLDVAMPRMSGLVALQEIRILLPSIRCCLMTAHRRNIAVDQSLTEAAIHVLDKPFDLSEFLTTLGDLLATSRMGRLKEVSRGAVKDIE